MSFIKLHPRRHHQERTAGGKQSTQNWKADKQSHHGVSNKVGVHTDATPRGIPLTQPPTATISPSPQHGSTRAQNAGKESKRVSIDTALTLRPLRWLKFTKLFSSLKEGGNRFQGKAELRSRSKKVKVSFELETEAGLLSKEHWPTSGRAGSSQRAHLALSTG